MAGRKQVLVAVLHPLDRGAEPACQPGHDDLLRVHVGLLTEPTADVWNGHSYLLTSQAQDLSRDPREDVRDLGRAPDTDPALVRRSESTPGLDRGGAVAGVAEAAFDHGRRLRERLLDRTRLADALKQQVAFPVVQKDPRVGVEWIGDRGQRLELEPNRLQRVLGVVPGTGHRYGDWLADEPHPLRRAQRAGRAERQHRL